MNKYLYSLVIFILIILTFFLIQRQTLKSDLLNNSLDSTSPINLSHPLSIEAMRYADYPGSDLTIEQTLEDGFGFNQYVVSYKSEALKIDGLLTVPIGVRPNEGWPVIIFNHGYISPSVYQTTERYVDYVGAFASQGYIVFKPDYRGHGSSEGQPEGAYYSPAYTVDVLNALASIKKYPDANPNKIGMWGHSMGGSIALRSIVVKPDDFKAVVIWGGVVGTYDDLMNNWQRRPIASPPPQELALRHRSRSQLIEKFGTPQTNPDFWHSIDPNFYLLDIKTPIQLHAGLSDEEVPYQFSEGLNQRLQAAGKSSELFTYPGADHNISDPSFSIAISRSIEFFDKHLK